MSLRSYIFDTNIFNAILDDTLKIESIEGKARFLATHVQQDEINKTSRCERREQLSSTFEAAVTATMPTASAVWDTSRWDQANWGIEDGLYNTIKLDLDRRNKSKSNNIQDALIAETAIRNSYTLVTHDSDLYVVATNHQGACENVYQLFAEIKTGD